MRNHLILYTNPMSRGQIARWMLEEVGEPYEQRLLEYGTTMKAPDYLAINPMGKVPALVHDGRVVTECAAICAYLADAFPAAKLAPSLSERADYYRWLFFAAGPVESAVTNQAMGWISDEPKRQGMLGYGSFEQMLDVLEKGVAKSRWISGNGFSAADVYLGSQLIWGMEFGTIPSREAFVTYTSRLRERPAYIKAKAIDNDLIAQAQGHAVGA